jgi:pimeloyl-ACP methyl ester carboxylesterase
VLKAIPATLCMVMAGILMRSVDESRFVKGPAGRLHVDVRGAGGLPVVFVPSLAGTTRHWDPQLAHLAAERQVLAVDLRGHGRSDPPASSAYAPEDFGRDLHAVLDALDIPRAVIVGHSMGSAAALAFASEQPSRVAGLLLVDPVDDPLKRPPDPDFEKWMARLESADYEETIEGYWRQILTDATPHTHASVMADLRATPQRTVVESMRALARFDSSRALARYPGPVMSVTTPLNDYPSSLHRLHAGLAHQRMTGVSHWLQLDRAPAFNQILDIFLDTIR